MILSVRRCSTKVALTEAPSSSGVPVETLAPSPTISTSPNSTVAPGSPSSFSTAITSSLATVYCLPPVRITANMALLNFAGTDIGWRARRGKPRLGKRGPGRPPRPGAAHYSCAPLPVNVFGPLEPVRDVARTARLDSRPNPPPLADRGGADHRSVRQRPYRRFAGDRRRRAATPAYLSGRPCYGSAGGVGRGPGGRGGPGRTGGG